VPTDPSEDVGGIGSWLSLHRSLLPMVVDHWQWVAACRHALRECANCRGDSNR
jgi:hypothetical protein